MFLLQGCYNSQQVAVKLYNLHIRGAVAAYETEKRAYQQLAAIQGEVIPKLVCNGNLAHLGVPIIVTQLAGVPVKKGGTMPKKAIRQALQAFHDAGAAYGDVRLSNFVVDKTGKVYLLDLGQAVINASSDERADEKNILKRLLE